jgi:hypothetical protein
MSLKAMAGIDPEDITAKQWRKIFREMSRTALMRGKRKDCEDGDCEEEEDATADKENDDLVNLHEEHKGDSRPPKVTKADLPKGVKMPEEDDEDDIQIAKTKKGKK